MRNPRICANDWHSGSRIISNIYCSFHDENLCFCIFLILVCRTYCTQILVVNDVLHLQSNILNHYHFINGVYTEHPWSASNTPYSQLSKFYNLIFYSQVCKMYGVSCPHATLTWNCIHHINYFLCTLTQLVTMKGKNITIRQFAVHLSKLLKLKSTKHMLCVHQLPNMTIFFV